LRDLSLDLNELLFRHTYSLQLESRTADSIRLLVPSIFDQNRISRETGPSTQPLCTIPVKELRSSIEDRGTIWHPSRLVWTRRRHIPIHSSSSAAGWIRRCRRSCRSLTV